MSLFPNTFIEVTVFRIIPVNSGHIKNLFLKSDLFSSSCRKIHVRTVRTSKEIDTKQTPKHLISIMRHKFQRFMRDLLSNLRLGLPIFNRNTGIFSGIRAVGKFLLGKVEMKLERTKLESDCESWKVFD